jgi:hypothetical protein
MRHALDASAYEACDGCGAYDVCAGSRYSRAVKIPNKANKIHTSRRRFRLRGAVGRGGSRVCPDSVCV